MLKGSTLQKAFFIALMLFSGFAFLLNSVSFVFKFIPDILKEFGYSSFFIFLAAAVFVSVLCISFILLQKTDKHLSSLHFGFLLFILPLLLKIIFISILNVKNYSDFQLFYWITVKISQNDTSYLKGQYFHIWAYQVGFPAIMSLFARIFGSNELTLILINNVFQAVINLLVYLISRQMVSEKYARIFATAYLLMPFTFSLSNVYTNQHLSTMLFYLGIYSLFKKPLSVPNVFTCCLCLVVGNIARPEGITVILAFAILIITIVFNKAHSNKSRTIALITSLIFCYFIFIQLSSSFFIASGLSREGLKNNFPLYKLVVGLNSSTAGTFSEYDSEALFETDDYLNNPSQRDLEAMELIKERILVNPVDLFTLFAKKVRAMWSSDPNWYPAFHEYANNDIKAANLKIPAKLITGFFSLIDYIYYFILYLLLMLYSYISIKQKEQKMLGVFLSLFFIIGFFIFLLIEVQHRYSYLLMPAVYILSSAAFEEYKKLKSQSKPLSA